MDSQDLSFLDAIRIAKDTEKKAAAFYNEAAEKTNNPLGRELFEKLADFECYHFTSLTALEESLCENGACILYEGRELSLSVPEEVQQIKEANTMSAMRILAQARDIKTKARKRYSALAEQTTDPSGRDMFLRLAEEESVMLRVLDKAYWSMNDHAVWELPADVLGGADAQSCAA